jgi:hypothetical protein
MARPERDIPPCCIKQGSRWGGEGGVKCGFICLGWVYYNWKCCASNGMMGKLIDGCEVEVYSVLQWYPSLIKWKSLIHWKETQGQRQNQASWAHHTSNYFGSWLGLKIRERLCKGRSRFHLISKILGNVRKMFTRC